MVLVEAANMLLQFANGIWFDAVEFEHLINSWRCMCFFLSLCSDRFVSINKKKWKMSDNQTRGRILLNRFKLWFIKFMQIDLEIDFEISLKTMKKGTDPKANNRLTNDEQISDIDTLKQCVRHGLDACMHLIFIRIHKFVVNKTKANNLDRRTARCVSISLNSIRDIFSVFNKNRPFAY